MAPSVRKKKSFVTLMPDRDDAGTAGEDVAADG